MSLRARTPAGFAERVDAWLNDPFDPLWERPGPTARQRRNDLWWALAMSAVGVAMVVLTKSMGMVFEGEATWRAYVAAGLMPAPLALRRRYPLTMLLVASGMFVALSYLSPEASVQVVFQVSYFAALYAAVAWARDRRGLWIAMGAVLLAMALWITASFTLSSYLETIGVDAADADGVLPPLTATVIYTAAINLAYFGGAILAGRASWRSALQRERLEHQADQIREQSVELARRAVVDERLRIARELHDVVAHHVSVIGVQAGAARKVLAKDPELATDALRVIEGASRSAVGEMRSLLGVLRSETHTERGDDAARGPGPRLADLSALVAEAASSGLDVRLTTVVEPDGSLDAVPAPVGLSLYRVVQESLSNVARHSSATQVQVSVRVVTHRDLPGWAEVEIVDDGRLVGGTEGSGYGLRGIRERAALHGGEAEIGPRAGQAGWRVRVRIPVPSCKDATGVLTPAGPAASAGPTSPASPGEAVEDAGAADGPGAAPRTAPPDEVTPSGAEAPSDEVTPSGAEAPSGVVAPSDAVGTAR